MGAAGRGRCSGTLKSRTVEPPFPGVEISTPKVPCRPPLLRGWGGESWTQGGPLTSCRVASNLRFPGGARWGLQDGDPPLPARPKTPGPPGWAFLGSPPPLCWDWRRISQGRGQVGDTPSHPTPVCALAPPLEREFRFAQKPGPPVTLHAPCIGSQAPRWLLFPLCPGPDPSSYLPANPENSSLPLSSLERGVSSAKASRVPF